MPHYFTTIFSDINKGLPDGRNYLFMCEQAKNALNQKEYEYHSFPELSYYAWKSNQSGKTEENTTTTVDSNIKETNYWIYSPGDNASMWDEFYKLSKKAIKFVLLAATSMMIYFMIFAREGVLFLSGEAFGGAVVPMIIVYRPTAFIYRFNLILWVYRCLFLWERKMLL